MVFRIVARKFGSMSNIAHVKGTDESKRTVIVQNCDMIHITHGRGVLASWLRTV